jgi:hypothetical protein
MGQSIQGLGAFQRTAGLVQEARVAVPLEHVDFDDAAQHVALRVGHLSLATTCLVLLTALIAADGFAKQVRLAIERLHQMARLVIAELRHGEVGRALQDLAHGGLRHAELLRDLALRPPRRVERPGPLGARVHDGGGLMAAGATTMGTTTTGRHPCAAAGASTFRTAPPLKAVQRSRMTCT